MNKLNFKDNQPIYLEDFEYLQKGIEKHTIGLAGSMLSDGIISGFEFDLQKNILSGGKALIDGEFIEIQELSSVPADGYILLSLKSENIESRINPVSGEKEYLYHKTSGMLKYGEDQISGVVIGKLAEGHYTDLRCPPILKPFTEKHLKRLGIIPGNTPNIPSNLTSKIKVITIQAAHHQPRQVSGLSISLKTVEVEEASSM